MHENAGKQKLLCAKKYQASRKLIQIRLTKTETGRKLPYRKRKLWSGNYYWNVQKPSGHTTSDWRWILVGFTSRRRQPKYNVYATSIRQRCIYVGIWRQTNVVQLTCFHSVEMCFHFIYLNLSDSIYRKGVKLIWSIPTSTYRYTAPNVVFTSGSDVKTTSYNWTVLTLLMEAIPCLGTWRQVYVVFTLDPNVGFMLDFGSIWMSDRRHFVM